MNHPTPQQVRNVTDSVNKIKNHIYRHLNEMDYTPAEASSIMAIVVADFFELLAKSTGMSMKEIQSKFNEGVDVYLAIDKFYKSTSIN